MTRRLAIPLLVVVALAALDGGLRRWRDGRAAAPPSLHVLDIPVPVRPFSAQDLDGRPISPADWRGRFALVNVWATWCVPCRVEIPDLAALQTSQRERLIVIGVLQDQVSADTARRFASALGVNYPIVFSTWDIERAFGETLVLPTSYLVNPAGLIVATQIGRIAPDSIVRLMSAQASVRGGGLIAPEGPEA